jgi:hypothetical protein
MLVQHRLHPLYSQNKKRREDAFRSGALQVPEKKTSKRKTGQEKGRRKLCTKLIRNWDMSEVLNWKWTLSVMNCNGVSFPNSVQKGILSYHKLYIARRYLQRNTPQSQPLSCIDTVAIEIKISF